jgi:regulator of replication initiation timing
MMTDELLQKIESKMMVLLAELEESRDRLVQLSEENTHLKNEKSAYTKKLHSLLSLFDVIEKEESISAKAPMTHEEWATC